MPDSFAATQRVDKASLFNNYFYSVFVRSSYQLPPISDLKQPLSFLSEINISELDVFGTLRSLDPSKAMGCDKISQKLLKNCALALYQPLHHLFSLSLSQSYLPSEWRTHLIKTGIQIWKSEFCEKLPANFVAMYCLQGPGETCLQLYDLLTCSQ